MLFKHVPPMCSRCKRLHEDSIEDWITDGTIRCDAFPDGVPGEIKGYSFDHRNPHPEDNEIQFELADNENQETVNNFLDRMFMSWPKLEKILQTEHKTMEK
jgi:hypothetical protein